MEEPPNKSTVTPMFSNCQRSNDTIFFHPESDTPMVGRYKEFVFSKQHVLHSKHLSLGYHQIL